LHPVTAGYTRRTLDQRHVTRQPALKSGDAADRAQPGAHPPREARTLAGRDLAARDGCQNGEQKLLEFLHRAQ